MAQVLVAVVTVGGGATLRTIGTEHREPHTVGHAAAGIAGRACSTAHKRNVGTKCLEGGGQLATRQKCHRFDCWPAGWSIGRGVVILLRQNKPLLLVQPC